MRAAAHRAAVVAALVFSLAACRPGAPLDPIAVARETVATLDRAYTRWYQAEAAVATTRPQLDRLVEAERTWEQWFGRVARLLAIADRDAPNDRKAAVLAIENEIEQARRWLVTLGALAGPKGGR